MKTFTVSLIPEEDCDFLNRCTIVHEVRSKSQFGFWMDFTTNLPILANGDVAEFITDNSEDELALRLKFGNRITQL